MKVFISSSKNDRAMLQQLAQALTESGHKVFYENLNIKSGDNWFKKINEAIKDFEAVVIILSRETMNSKSAMMEMESIVLNDISKKSTRIIPVITDKSVLPSYLMNYGFIDMSRNLDYGIEKLRALLAEGSQRIHHEGLPSKESNQRRNAIFSKRLKASLKSGELTLVCGAGVSIGADIPDWNALLLDLLETMIARIANDPSLSLTTKSSASYKSLLGSSSLVMGKYLKSNLGKDFLPELRDALYKNNPISCDLIDAIVEISRPQRDGKPLDSIITFNFDALIEENLAANNIKFKAIEKEGIRNLQDELPIYHVHGFLPRKGKIGSDKNIVFSEDSYHTQFIEPFSWSNLIQLNKLSQNTCLFIGLSLNDPNLRRLLDVANRKDPTNNLNHYIIKKIPSLDNDATVDELLMFLEEQDANELGLNVLWVNEFDEIGDLIRDLIR
ncbi:TIR domain-containing protein [Sediminicola luteus]|uniref:Molecular chaperone Tir n=1 Tax=Sediminicola luteus TaxID=319238 RepID=A0A2A4GBD4_9FLAO|nr:TIR domain-containing protein [Sediminicola luteus]PCE65907.1 molecular chaperone Tir [Sediminicola luteus]